MEATESDSNGTVSTRSKQITLLNHEVKNLKSLLSRTKIQALTENQKNINDKNVRELCAQERYSKKDSVLIINPPFDSRNVEKCFILDAQVFR